MAVDEELWLVLLVDVVLHALKVEHRILEIRSILLHHLPVRLADLLPTANVADFALLLALSTVAQLAIVRIGLVHVIGLVTLLTEMTLTAESRLRVGSMERRLEVSFVTLGVVEVELALGASTAFSGDRFAFSNVIVAKKALLLTVMTPLGVID